MSTAVGYHDECEGYHEYSGSVQYTGGYHDECGDIMSTRGMFGTLGFPYKFNCFPNDLLPHLS